MAALIELSADDNDHVRDWATFGIGQMLDVDSVAVRDALMRRLDDRHDDTRFEGLVGLARRRDRRAVPVTLAALQAETVFTLAVEAAAYLADDRLLPALEALRAWWDVDLGLLESAITSCDPQVRRHDLTLMNELAGALQQALDEADTGLAAAFSCQRTQEPGVDLHLMRPGEGSDGPMRLIRDVARLLYRAGGVRAAFEAVMADVAQRPCIAGIGERTVSAEVQLANRSWAPVSIEGWRSFANAARSIWRIRSRVRPRMAPTSSRVRGSPRSKP